LKATIERWFFTTNGLPSLPVIKQPVAFDQFC
jgi:hypothetical protein